VSEDVVTVPPTFRALRRDWVSLAGAETQPERFDEDSVRGMPEPARRRLTHAIAPGTSLWSSVILAMRGRIRLGAWRRFKAREVLSPPRGFIWAATARIVGLPVTGFSYVMAIVALSESCGPSQLAHGSAQFAHAAVRWPGAFGCQGSGPETRAWRRSPLPG
jgi:hypothetical protein